MYSNRFLIKTMQMVGATRWFIAKPINARAVINGLIASGIAIALIWCIVLLVETFRPEFKVLQDNKSLILLFLSHYCFGHYYNFSKHTPGCNKIPAYEIGRFILILHFNKYLWLQ